MLLPSSLPVFDPGSITHAARKTQERPSIATVVATISLQVGNSATVLRQVNPTPLAACRNGRPSEMPAGNTVTTASDCQDQSETNRPAHQFLR